MAVIRVKSVEVNDIAQDDIIVVLMGPTGVGKTTFIDYATRQGGTRVFHELYSPEPEVQAVRVSHRNHSIVLVDTPGLDDTSRSDEEIWGLIVEWFVQTYKKHPIFAGIIYLLPITDNRMAGTRLADLRRLRDLCGNDAVRNVIIATTMWTEVNSEVGPKREKERHEEHFKGMLELGAGTARFLDSYESAWGIIEVLLKKDPVDAFSIQKEMVDLRKPFCETAVGKSLHQKMMLAVQENLREVPEEAKRQNNEDAVKELNKEYERRGYGQIMAKVIPLSRRILDFFTFRRDRANA